jgi:nicotinamidase-related amidase
VRCPSRPNDHITLLPQQLWPEHCVQDTPLVALHPLLATSPHDLLIHKGWKQHVDAYSAFFDNGKLQQTGLHSRLSQGDNITRVVLVGVALEYCVKYTALDAAELGYETWLVREATAGVDRASSDAAVQEMVSRGVKVIGTVQEALQMLADTTGAGKAAASKPAVTLTASTAAAGGSSAAASQVSGARGQQQGAAAAPRTEL